MYRMKKDLIQSLFLVGMLVHSSCHSDENITTQVQPQVYLMFSVGGLGDGGYNDQILRGVQHTATQHPDVHISFSSPFSMEKAEKTFKEWVNEKEYGKSLFILAGSEYEQLATRYADKITALPQNRDVLLFESQNSQKLPVYSFQLSMYGASYLSGKSVSYMGCTAPLAITGNANDATLQWAIDGFQDGYGEKIATESLAEDWKGYAMADEVYKRMFDYTKSYDYFFGLAGGSNYGIYRYLREYPNGRIWTAGMDVEQSNLTMKMTGSIVKHIDQLIQDYLDNWIAGNEMPEHETYGLESYYIEWSVSPHYKDFFGNFVEENIQEAIRKEKEYENK